MSKSEKAALEQSMDRSLAFVQTKLPAIKTEKGLAGVWCAAYRAGWEAATRRARAATGKPT